jgi:hypothetical protein
MPDLVTTLPDLRAHDGHRRGAGAGHLTLAIVGRRLDRLQLK